MLLGFRLIAVDPEAGTIEVAFDAGQQFLNPAGHIQGGFLAAMLDDTLGPALVATLRPRRVGPDDLAQRPVPGPAAPGELRGRGRVVRRGRDIGFLAGELTAPDGAIVASATATAVIRRRTV